MLSRRANTMPALPLPSPPQEQCKGMTHAEQAAVLEDKCELHYSNFDFSPLWAFLADLSALFISPSARRVLYSTAWAHADWVVVGACDPMVCPIHVSLIVTVL